MDLDNVGREHLEVTAMRVLIGKNERTKRMRHEEMQSMVRLSKRPVLFLFGTAGLIFFAGIAGYLTASVLPTTQSVDSKEKIVYNPCKANVPYWVEVKSNDGTVWNVSVNNHGHVYATEGAAHEDNEELSQDNCDYDRTDALRVICED